MANIGTINVRFYALDGIFDDLFDKVDILYLLLEDRFSYCVPIYVEPGASGLCFDIQYGARWANASAVYSVIEKYGHLIDRTWIRYSDSGDDEDRIFCWHGEKFNTRKCRYGIDRIKIYSQESPDENWQADVDGWTLAVEGSYQTLNSRDNLGERMCPISTLTTPAMDSADIYELMPEAFARIYETLPKDRYRIEYLWQDRIVHVSFPCQPDDFSEDRWIEYSLDYWDNCIDPEYLEYHKRMRNLWVAHLRQ
jgi:hypothetical protein